MVDSRNSNTWFDGTDTDVSHLHPCVSTVYTVVFVLQGLRSLRGSIEPSLCIDSKLWTGEILQTRKWCDILDHIVFLLSVHHVFIFQVSILGPVPLIVQKLKALSFPNPYAFKNLNLNPHTIVQATS